MIDPLRALLALALVAFVAGCSSEPEATAWEPGSVEGQITIHVPERLDGLETSVVSPLGEPVRVRCATCHEGRAAPEAEWTEDLSTFHVGLQLEHGTLSCGSCHDSEDRDRLRLANGDTLPTDEVVSLCAQCHGPQYRDYQHGAHGGMRGHWDLTRGDRERNNCVDCHDAHAPAYPIFMPAAAPRDRRPHHTAVGGHQ